MLTPLLNLFMFRGRNFQESVVLEMVYICFLQLKMLGVRWGRTRISQTEVPTRFGCAGL